ncbi:hypothetical protein P175DRAFT_0431745 [Aspergillus ochraceoroseus IBT 24754]|uniref:MARVEL domain-containing protein n=2 Tax=Aspergillus ochraceoroseus TaxID=138278 RepID=A0A2T5M3R5_9EURO|nr:uncharacterized protein P175DRAFT_0431745 [Aspergillus ochraceoroseus IBT 24754]KKK17193.1 hypothetical protein AOCH_005328 [Aspergillus ochraceoroseus]PTU23180.1 hypothetical protein P175DRAFT_0431745 [Aspergillus ochraceoroseus IBT 24754]
MGIGGPIIRFFNLAIRALQFIDAAVILGIFSYFLAILSKHDQSIPQWIRAVEGLSGAAALYALLATLFTCVLGGVSFFAFLGIVLDVCFIGAMIAIAIMTRDGTQSCSGTVNTPLGTGASDADSASKVSFGFACRLEKVAFAVSIIGIFFFLISIFLQYLLARHHKREKRFGPSPANGYTYGTQRRGFWRRNKNSPDNASGDDILPTHPTPNELEKNGFFSRGYFSRKNDPSTQATTRYGNSAYTGNY